MKLILGTANASSLYSLNQSKKINKKNFINILNVAYKNKIKFFDTAPKYKNAEKIIGNLKYKDLNIISKISNIKNKELKKTMLNEFYDSKKKLKIKKLYGLLIHDINFFKKRNTRKIVEILKEIKRNKLVNKIGFSVYEPNDVDFILKFIKPDIIQLPLSVLDRRFLSTKKIDKLKSLNIEVHVRSIFMKGLLLLDDNKILRTLPNFKFVLEKYKNWCLKNKISRHQAAINFIKNVRNINGVVFGVDNTDQLTSIINSFKKKSSVFPKNIYLGIPKKHLDIRRWKI